MLNSYKFERLSYYRFVYLHYDDSIINFKDSCTTSKACDLQNQKKFMWESKYFLIFTIISEIICLLSLHMFICNVDFSQFVTCYNTLSLSYAVRVSFIYRSSAIMSESTNLISLLTILNIKKG